MWRDVLEQSKQRNGGAKMRCFLNQAGKAIHILSACAAVMSCSSVATAGLAYVSQNRVVSASTPDGASSRTAASFGAFSASVASHEPAGGNNASASMVSHLEQAAIGASGSVAANSGGPPARFAAQHEIVFDVVRPTSYTFSAALLIRQFDVFGFDLPGPLFSVRLGSVGSSAPLIDERWTDSDIFSLTHGAPAVNRVGLLEAGRYALEVNVQSTLFEGGEQFDYNLSFKTRADPSAVPLPPAGWAGLLMLAGLVAGKWWTARRGRPVVARGA
jgi:hypothetical protein